MMKTLLSALFGIFMLNAISAQTYLLRGLEIYNPQYLNPAFTAIDHQVQADIISFENLYYRWTQFNVMGNLPGTKSSLGINFGGSAYFRNSGFSSSPREMREVYITDRSLGLNYAYTREFTEQLSVSSGVELQFSNLNFKDTTFSVDSRFSAVLRAGVRVKYRKHYAGLSFGNSLLQREKRTTTSGETSIGFEVDPSPYILDFIAGTSLGGERRVTMDPVIGIRYSNHQTMPYLPRFAYYVGAHVTLVDVIGLGFTMGDQKSLSASLAFPDRVRLMVGVFQTESELSRYTGLEYKLGFDPLQYMIQLRINL